MTCFILDLLQSHLAKSFQRAFDPYPGLFVGALHLIVIRQEPSGFPAFPAGQSDLRFQHLTFAFEFGVFLTESNQLFDYFVDFFLEEIELGGHGRILLHAALKGNTG